MSIFSHILYLQIDYDKLSEKSSESPAENSEETFVEIDLSSENPSLIASTVRRSSSGYIEIAKALMGSKRDTLLKIVETDDDES
jgi:hypothetical protein